MNSGAERAILMAADLGWGAQAASERSARTASSLLKAPSPWPSPTAVGEGKIDRQHHQRQSGDRRAHVKGLRHVLEDDVMLARRHVEGGEQSVRHQRLS